MKIIYGVYQVSNTNEKVFHNDLCDAIRKLQDDKQEVEVQYTTTLAIDGTMCYSALILGRKEARNECPV